MNIIPGGSDEEVSGCGFYHNKLGCLFQCSSCRGYPAIGSGRTLRRSCTGREIGGDQLAVDVKLGERPIAISISQEYHKKDPVPDSSYEIGSLVTVNVLYMTQIIKERANVFLGGGIGGLSAPRIGDPGAMERGFLFDLVGGVNVKLFWKIGVYIEGKYIYCKKTINDIKVIDFSNPGALLGISLNFGW